MATWASTYGGSGDRVSRAVYDRKSQLVYSVDAEGYVTQQIFNKLGAVTKQIRLADAYTVTGTPKPSDMATLIGTVPSSAHVTEFKYDTAGRLTNRRSARHPHRHDAGSGRADPDLHRRLRHVRSEHDDADLRCGAPPAHRQERDRRHYGADATTAYGYDALGRQTTSPRPAAAATR